MKYLFCFPSLLVSFLFYSLFPSLLFHVSSLLFLIDFLKLLSLLFLGDEDSANEENIISNGEIDEDKQETTRYSGGLGPLAPPEDIDLPPEFELRESQRHQGHLGVFSLVNIPEGTAFTTRGTSPAVEDLNRYQYSQISDHFSVSKTAHFFFFFF